MLSLFWAWWKLINSANNNMNKFDIVLATLEIVHFSNYLTIALCLFMNLILLKYISPGLSLAHTPYSIFPTLIFGIDGAPSLHLGKALLFNTDPDFTTACIMTSQLSCSAEHLSQKQNTNMQLW